MEIALRIDLKRQTQMESFTDYKPCSAFLSDGDDTTPPSIGALSTDLNASSRAMLRRQKPSELNQHCSYLISPIPLTSTADDDDATPPSMDLTLGTDLDDELEGDAGTSKALKDFFNTATNEAARSAAEEALAQLSVSGDLPSDISLERAIQLVVKGKKTSIRRMGLTVVVAVSRIGTLLFVF
jgi:hypothetical protein